jgi:hypothetical protein
VAEGWPPEAAATPRWRSCFFDERVVTSFIAYIVPYGTVCVKRKNMLPVLLMGKVTVANPVV